MKIAFILTRSDEIGGAQIHVRDMATQLKNKGHDAIVLIGGDGPLLAQMQNLGIKYYVIDDLEREIKLIKDIKSTLKIRSILKKEKPDIVSTHSSKAGIVGRLAAVTLRIPAIFTAHGWAFADGVSETKKKIYIIIEKLFARFTKRIITVSEQDKQLAIHYQVADRQKQISINNGMPEIEPEFVKDNKLKKSFQTNNTLPIQLISVARFSEQKDHETLFRSLAKINSVEWNLRLVGIGPKLETAKNLTSELGINNKVEFLGERHDVKQLLSNSDVFLLISNWEGFPRSIIEAMRAGLPVIASNVGGVNESVQDGKTGYLIERKNIKQLNLCLEALLTNTELRASMGNEARECFLEQFEFNFMFNKTLRVYEEVIG